MTTKAATALAILLSTAACTHRQASVDVVYAVSIEPQRWLLEQLADSTATIVTMLPAGANPETFDPPMSLRSKAERASAYFSTGALPFETSFKEVSQSLFFDTSAGIERIYGTHDHLHAPADEHHDHGEADPHFWTSVSGVRQMAANMAEALKKIDPDNSRKYDARLLALRNRLDSIDSSIRRRLAQPASRTFAIWHPSLSYFARDYGLHQLSVGQESKEMSARQMREAIDEAKADSVRVFFFQSQYDAQRAQTISDAIGARMVTINPLAYDWDCQINLITDELSRP